VAFTLDRSADLGTDLLKVYRLMLLTRAFDERITLLSHQGRIAISASVRGHKPIVERLLAHGADVNATDGHGRSPLILAAQTGQLPTVALLLQHGADINAQVTGTTTYTMRISRAPGKIG